MAKKETTAIVSVPALVKETAPVVKMADALEVKDEASKEKAATVLNNLKDVLDRVTKYKEAKTKPLNQALKVIRDETRDLEGNLKTAIDSTRSKLGAYQTEQKRIADKKAEDIAARVGEGKGHFTTETAVRKIDELEKPAGTVSTGAGEVKFRTTQKLRVTDTKVVIKWLIEHDKADICDFKVNELLKLLRAGVIVDGAYLEEVQEAASYR